MSLIIHLHYKSKVRVWITQLEMKMKVSPLRLNKNKKKKLLFLKRKSWPFRNGVKSLDNVLIFSRHMKNYFLLVKLFFDQKFDFWPIKFNYQFFIQQKVQNQKFRPRKHVDPSWHKRSHVLLRNSSSTTKVRCGLPKIWIKNSKLISSM